MTDGRAGAKVSEAELFELDGVDDLYAVEPSEFVAKRTETVKALKAAGDKATATAVAKLPKPTVVAWAVNQVARRDAAAIDELLSVSAKVRDAQAQAVRGEDAASLRTASRERRRLLQELADAAASFAGATHRDEAAVTLDAASLDEEHAQVLRAGRLTRALEPSSGFGLADMPDPPAQSARRPERKATKRDDEGLHRAAEDLESAEHALERAEEGVRRADENLQSAMDALQNARAERDATLSARNDARDALRRLR